MDSSSTKRPRSVSGRGALDVVAVGLAACIALAAWQLGRGHIASGQGLRCPVPVQVNGALVCEPVWVDGVRLGAGDGHNNGLRRRMPPSWLAALRVSLPLNHAPAAELESIRGVGPVTARKLVEGRPYTRLEDVQRVHGIGPAKQGAIGRRVHLGAQGPPTQDGRAP